MAPPRVAYFPDSFHEINGVAHTSRNFIAYAEKYSLPFLCVRAGTQTVGFHRYGELWSLELPRSSFAVGMEKDLAFDPLFWRYANTIEEALHRFQPDLIHLTGPSELGIFAAYFAWKLKIPLAASWHTNIHEYAAKRLTWLTSLMSKAIGAATAHGVEVGSLGIMQRFYSIADVLFAPNPDLCAMLATATGKPCQPMLRGVDTALFTPERRTRARTIDAPFTLGYVGRLSVEKNVKLLPQIQRELDAMGLRTRFVMIGHGTEEAELREAMPTADFTGVLRGEGLARAYANMDLLVFPSHTDTFGNVVLEALASGVPAVVTPHGGPQYILRDPHRASPERGVVAEDSQASLAIAQILRQPERLQAMRRAARGYALTCSWDAVFDLVYAAYLPALERCECAGEGIVSSPAWPRSSPRYTP